MNLNEFFDEAAKSKTLTVTHMRARGAVPYTEPHARKMVSLMREHGISSAEAHVEQLDAINNGRLTYAQVIQQITEARPEFKAYASLTPNTEPVTRDHLDIFAHLHGLGYAAFQEAFEGVPGSGRTIAGGVVALLPQDGDVAKRIAGVDSVHTSAFADTYAVLVRAKVDGVAAGLEMAKQVRDLREGSGDFTKFASARQSHDTRRALDAAISMLEGGFVDMSQPSRGDIVDYCLSMANKNTMSWLEERGLPTESAQTFSKFLDDVSTSFRKVAPEKRMALKDVAGNQLSSLMMSGPKPEGLH